LVEGKYDFVLAALAPALLEDELPDDPAYYITEGTVKPRSDLHKKYGKPAAEAATIAKDVEGRMAINTRAALPITID